MGCSEQDRALQEYAAGELPPQRAAELERHLRSCASCRDSLRAYRTLLRALPELLDPATPPGLHQGIMLALRAQQPVWRLQRESTLHTLARRGMVAVLLCAMTVSLTVALWGWAGRIGSFAANRFSRDLLAFWESAKDLWYVLSLLGGAVRVLESVGRGLIESSHRTAQTLLPWSPLLLPVYAGLLLAGGWLCWRALRGANERRWHHAS